MLKWVNHPLKEQIISNYCLRNYSAHNIKNISILRTGKFLEGFVLRSENSYRIFFQQKGKYISPWHDIPLFADKEKKIVNYINEIPRGSVEKFEIATDEPHNPIKQDVCNNGKLRSYHFESLVNYGALPQTWEDPNHKDEFTGLYGDKDPLDVVEIGSTIHLSGEVYQVKILGILGLIDQKEMDWKIIGIDLLDPLSKKIDDIKDVEEYMPNKIENLIRWFKHYKRPDGKKENKFAFNDKPKDPNFALDIVQRANNSWKNFEAIKNAGLWK